MLMCDDLGSQLEQAECCDDGGTNGGEDVLQESNGKSRRIDGYGKQVHVSS